MLHCVLYLLFFIPLCYSSNILAIYPMNSMSHVMIGIAITKELALRGHNVTIITSYPQQFGMENYLEIYVEEIHAALAPAKEHFYEWENLDSFTLVTMCYNLGYKVTEITYENPKVQQLLNSNSSFDVVIMDHFFSEPLMGIAHHFKAPVILSSSLESPSWTHHIISNPETWAYFPHSFIKVTYGMPFLKRVENTIIHLFEEFYREFIAFPNNNKLLHKYMSNSPDIKELIYKVPLIFVNSHHSYNPPTARLPNLVAIGGIHVESSLGKISQELKKFLHEADEGIIYFSMGSNIVGATLPEDKKQAILKVFARLKQKILWKWERDLPGKPDNVRIEKWLPQTDILSHRNTKLFISHGGLAGTIEATYFGVPMLGIPIYCDQNMNIQRAVKNGYAVLLPYDDINEETFEKALMQLLNNRSFKSNATLRSNLLKDRPMKPLDEAVYWVEHIIKYNSSSHLRSPAMDLNWFQKMLLDVCLFITAVVCLVIFVFYKLIFRVLSNKNKNIKTD